VAAPLRSLRPTPAWLARRHGATILAYDGDLDRVARIVGIELDEASLRAP